MSTTFQTAVRTNVDRTTRLEAIDRLADRGERRNLALLVEMGGLRGEYRRHALERLADCDGTDELADLAENTTVEASLRRRAGELA